MAFSNIGNANRLFWGILCGKTMSPNKELSFFFLIIYLFLFYLYGCFAFIYICVCVRVLDLLELELQRDVAAMYVLVLWKSSQCS